MNALTWAAGSTLLGLLLIGVLVGLLRRRRRPAVQLAGPGDEARRQHLRLLALVNALPQGVALSQGRRFEIANAAFCARMGWQHGELIGRSPFEVFSCVNRDDSLGAAVRTAFGEGQAYVGELDFRRRDGECFRARLRCMMVEPGEPASGTLWLLESAEVDAPAPSPHTLPSAACDPLTHLLTAAAFEAVLEQRLYQQQPLCGSLLVVDLDRFKQVNDSAGRAAGDALLCQVAVVLRRHLRDGDAVARLEGDSFAMLLPGRDAAGARQLGERLRLALSLLGVDHQGRRLSVGATVGVASIDAATGSTAADWMARAQAAWYEAKYGGRGAIRVAATPAAVALVEPA